MIHELHARLVLHREKGALAIPSYRSVPCPALPCCADRRSLSRVEVEGGK